ERRVASRRPRRGLSAALGRASLRARAQPSPGAGFGADRSRGVPSSRSPSMSTDSTDLDASIAPFIDLDLISQVCEPIKSGKEATVYRCRGTTVSRHPQLALKVYRPRAHRSFKNDARYREGSLLSRIGGGNTRAARALRNGTR